MLHLILTASLGLQAVPALPPPIVYDFEDGTTGRISLPAVPGWSFAVDGAERHGGRFSARLAADGLPPTPAAAAAAVSAAPYRGKPLRLSAWIRTEGAPAFLAGLWLRIDGADGRPVFLDNMYDRPVQPGDWTRVEAIALVPENAARIVFGPIKSGAGSLFVDDLVLEVPEPAQGAISAEASLYLDEALALLRTRHINRDRVDWDSVEGAAARLAAGAKTPADTHRVIRAVIALLGEPHTLLRPAQSAESVSPSEPSTPPADAVESPSGVMAAPGIGRLVLPALMTTGAAPEVGHAYRDRLVAAIGELESRGTCGWIVDLRGNGGGNMWPMLNGLEALLGGGPFGAFGQTGGADNFWMRTPDGIRAAETGEPASTLPAGVLSGDPVAVLLGRGTASSGEMTAIAFRGRARTRTFGAATAGFTTANAPFPLSDGSWLLVTTSRVHDGAGNLIEGALTPDEVTPEADAVEAAVAWLSTQGCRPVES